MIRSLSIVALAAVLLTSVLFTSSAEARWRRGFGIGRPVTPRSYSSSNYPSTSHYPGSSKDYAHLPFYMRAERRALGLTP